MSVQTPRIGLIFGDGIGPEALTATLQIVQEADAKLTCDAIEAGENAYKIGNLGGIAESGITTLKRCQFLLKAPTHTPDIFGHVSVMETIAMHFPPRFVLRPTGESPQHFVSAYAFENAEAQKTTEEIFKNMHVKWGADDLPESDWQIVVCDGLIVLESLQPDLKAHAGRDMADFMPLLHATCTLLDILDMSEIEARIRLAISRVQEDGQSIEHIGTTAMADAIIAKLWT